MRVLHVQKVAGIGGSERHLLALLPALAAKGVDVRMCVISAPQSRLFTAPLRASGVDVSTVPAGSHANPALAYRLAAEIRRTRPDIVHTHLIHGDLYGQLAAKLAGVPGVSSFHGALDFYKRDPYLTATRLAGRAVRGAIAISEFVASFMIENRLVPAPKVRVIPYGLDLSGWSMDPAGRDQMRRDLDVEPGDVVLGIASRLIPGKGHENLLKAFVHALQTAPNLRLLIAGDGPRRAALEAQAAATCPTGRVRFLGFVGDVRAFMNACDVVAMPTLPELNEGFGLAALEAMGAAKPVVATNVGSLPEVVVDGDTGLLVAPGSVRQLCEALVLLAGDAELRSRLGAQGAVRARDVFGLDSMVRRTKALYDEVVSTPA
jgi:glycosyltransferase involved in cell wall biosynthesis